MTFDELMKILVENREDLLDSNVNEQSLELIQEVLNTGANILNKLPRERVAGMIALIQMCVTIASLENDEPVVSILSQNDMFQSALVYAVQACVGIMTMEEVR